MFSFIHDAFRPFKKNYYCLRTFSTEWYLEIVLYFPLSRSIFEQGYSKEIKCKDFLKFSHVYPLFK